MNNTNMLTLKQQKKSNKRINKKKQNYLNQKYNLQRLNMSRKWLWQKSSMKVRRTQQKNINLEQSIIQERLKSNKNKIMKVKSDKNQGKMKFKENNQQTNSQKKKNTSRNQKIFKNLKMIKDKDKEKEKGKGKEKDREKDNENGRDKMKDEDKKLDKNKERKKDSAKDQETNKNKNHFGVNKNMTDLIKIATNRNNQKGKNKESESDKDKNKNKNKDARNIIEDNFRNKEVRNTKVMKMIMNRTVLSQMMKVHKNNKIGKRICINFFKRIKEQKHIVKEIKCKFNNQEQID